MALRWRRRDCEEARGSSQSGAQGTRRDDTRQATHLELPHSLRVVLVLVILVLALLLLLSAARARRPAVLERQSAEPLRLPRVRLLPLPPLDLGAQHPRDAEPLRRVCRTRVVVEPGHVAHEPRGADGEAAPPPLSELGGRAAAPARIVAQRSHVEPERVHLALDADRRTGVVARRGRARAVLTPVPAREELPPCPVHPAKAPVLGEGPPCAELGGRVETDVDAGWEAVEQGCEARPGEGALQVREGGWVVACVGDEGEEERHVRVGEDDARRRRDGAKRRVDDERQERERKFLRQLERKRVVLWRRDARA